MSDAYERKLTLVYDALEAHNWKGALKQATALLGKYKGDHLARLLKAWALKGSGKQPAALELCDEVAAEKPQVPRVLSVLDTLYCTLGQQHRADAVKLAALEAAPQDLQLVQAVFESYVRKRDYGAQYSLAMRGLRLHKDSDMFRWWAITALALQALHGPEGGEAGMSKPQTWRLAETMARKALEQALTKPPDPPHQHEESLRLYLAILQAQGKDAEAADAMHGPMGSFVALPYERLDLQAELHAKAGNKEAAAEAALQGFKQHQSWAGLKLFLSLACHGQAGAQEAWSQAQDCMSTLAEAAGDLSCPDPRELKLHLLSPRHRTALLAGIELDFCMPLDMWSGTSSSLADEESGHITTIAPGRLPSSFSFHAVSRPPAPKPCPGQHTDETEPASVPSSSGQADDSSCSQADKSLPSQQDGSWSASWQQYMDDVGANKARWQGYCAVKLLGGFLCMGHLVSCASDLRQYMAQLPRPLQQWVGASMSSAASLASDQEGTAIADVMQCRVAAHQVSSEAGIHAMQSPEAVKKLTKDLMQLHAAAVPHLPAQEKPGTLQGSSKASNKDSRFSEAAAEKLASSADVLPPIAVGALLSTAFHPGRDEQGKHLPLLQAVLCLAAAQKLHTVSAHLRLAASALWGLLGAPKLACQEFTALDVKNIQLTSVTGHFLYPLAESAASDAAGELRERLDRLHADYVKHCWEADMQAYDAGSYSQVLGFVGFRRQMTTCHTRLAAESDGSLANLRSCVDSPKQAEQLQQTVQGRETVSDPPEISFNHDLTMRPCWLPPFAGPARYMALHWWDSANDHQWQGTQWWHASRVLHSSAPEAEAFKSAAAASMQRERLLLHCLLGCMPGKGSAPADAAEKLAAATSQLLLGVSRPSAASEQLPNGSALPQSNLPDMVAAEATQQNGKAEHETALAVVLKLEDCIVHAAISLQATARQADLPASSTAAEGSPELSQSLSAVSEAWSKLLLRTSAALAQRPGSSGSSPGHEPWEPCWRGWMLGGWPWAAAVTHAADLLLLLLRAVQQHRKAWQQKSPERDKDLKSMVQQIADQQLPDLQPILKSFPDASEVLENLGHTGMARRWKGLAQAEAVQTVSSLLDEHRSLPADTARRWKLRQSLLSKCG